MKKLGFIVMMLMGMMFMSSCTHLTDKMLMDKHFGGKHELRRFNVYNEVTKESHGSYFLIMGSYMSRESSETKIRFCWKHPDGTYIFSEVGFDKIRLRIVNTDKPYIEFKLRRLDWKTDENNYNDYMDSVEESFRFVDYVIINCKEEDFPADVNLKDLK